MTDPEVIQMKADSRGNFISECGKYVMVSIYQQNLESLLSAAKVEPVFRGGFIAESSHDWKEFQAMRAQFTRESEGLSDTQKDKLWEDLSAPFQPKKRPLLATVDGKEVAFLPPPDWNPSSLENHLEKMHATVILRTEDWNRIQNLTRPKPKDPAEGLMMPRTHVTNSRSSRSEAFAEFVKKNQRVGGSLLSQGGPSNERLGAAPSSLWTHRRPSTSDLGEKAFDEQNVQKLLTSLVGSEVEVTIADNDNGSFVLRDASMSKKIIEKLKGAGIAATQSEAFKSLIFIDDRNAWNTKMQGVLSKQDTMNGPTG